MRGILKAALLIGVVANFGGAAQAGILGDTVTGGYFYPTVGNNIQNLGTAVVGPGVEFTGFQGAANADFTDTQLILTFIHAGQWANPPQNGPVFTDQTSPFTTVSIDSATTATWFTAGMISIDNVGTLVINWADQYFDPSGIIVLDLVPGAIPEPMSIALLAGGLMALSTARRRRVGDTPKNIFSPCQGGSLRCGRI